MADYINKDETIKAVREQYLTCDTDTDYNRGIQQGFDFAMTIIRNQPTANVVEDKDIKDMFDYHKKMLDEGGYAKITRCKDCNHANKKRLPQGSKWFASCDHFNTHSVMADDYCSYAERRESDADIH